MRKSNITGLGVALITPFTEEGSVDFTALDRLVDDVIAGGVDYLVVLGTTAETPTLSAAEKDQILQRVKLRNRDRKPIVIGIGGNSTAQVVEQIKNFDFTGIEAILSVTPYYNKPSQEGIYQHYKAIAEASPRGIILYNVPGRTGVNMCTATTLRLATEFPNIIAIKEASGNLGQVSQILSGRPEGFLVISGDDNMALPMIAMGGEGCISVAANAFQNISSEMITLAMSGKTADAALLHRRMIQTVDALFEEGNPTGIKAALSLQGRIKNVLRLPLVHSTNALNLKLADLIDINKLS